MSTLFCVFIALLFFCFVALLLYDYKSANRFADVRKIYLQKNTSLSRQNRNYPSFIVYLETIIQVYQSS